MKKKPFGTTGLVVSNMGFGVFSTCMELEDYCELYSAFKAGFGDSQGIS